MYSREQGTSKIQADAIIDKESAVSLLGKGKKKLKAKTKHRKKETEM